MPINSQTPMLLIGNGAGIAPLRAFLLERQWHLK
jgi:sulfite reductase alpha subunit-like flavoprotein